MTSSLYKVITLDDTGRGMKKLPVIVIFISIVSCSVGQKRYLSAADKELFLYQVKAYSSFRYSSSPYQHSEHLRLHQLTGDSIFFVVERKFKYGRHAFGGICRWSGKHISNYREVFVTPVTQKKELDAQMLCLFTSMVETGNVNEYIGKYDWISYPNEQVSYNSQDLRWEMNQ